MRNAITKANAPIAKGIRAKLATLKQSDTSSPKTAKARAKKAEALKASRKIKAGTGRLRGSIRTVTRTYPKKAIKGQGSAVVAIAGPGSRLAPHAHLIESGTAPRYYTTKRGRRKFVGAIKPTPFMRPGFDENKGKAKTILATQLGVEIEKAAKKLAAKKKK